MVRLRPSLTLLTLILLLLIAALFYVLGGYLLRDTALRRVRLRGDVLIACVPGEEDGEKPEWNGAGERTVRALFVHPDRIMQPGRDFTVQSRGEAIALVVLVLTRPLRRAARSGDHAAYGWLAVSMIDFMFGSRFVPLPCTSTKISWSAKRLTVQSVTGSSR